MVARRPRGSGLDQPTGSDRSRGSPQKASKIRKRSYSLIVVNEKKNTKIESMQKDAQN